MKVIQTVLRGEAVEDPVDAGEAVRIAQSEIRRRRKTRPVAVTAAVIGLVIAIVDLAEGTIGPALVLLGLVLVCGWQAWRSPRLMARLEEAERKNAALLG